jgi:uncharacterized RDD family membrane protein YckC
MSTPAVTVLLVAMVTPEAVVLDFPTSGLGSRGIAELLDLLVQTATFSLVVGSAALLAQGAGSTAAVIVGLIAYLVVFVGYPVILETFWQGRTLGKAAMGLRVVTVEGAPIRARHALIRGTMGIFEIYSPLALLAMVLIVFSKREQRLGDMLAGTIVVRERTSPAAAGTARAVTFPPPWGLEGYTASLDVSRLTGAQYGVLRSFLLRAHELSLDARAAVAVKLANAVALELQLTPPAGVPPEPFLASVASAYQRRG